MITGTVAWRLRTPPDPAIVKFPLVLPEDQVLTQPPSIAVSPDGTHVVYVANQQIYMRTPPIWNVLDKIVIPPGDKLLNGGREFGEMLKAANRETVWLQLLACTVC
jgi:hypothetical protein